MADMLVLSVCYCTEKDGPHVHVPVMRDSQYGLRVHPDEPRETVSAPAAETREPASRFAGVRHYAEPVARGSEKTHPGRVEDCKRCNFGQPAPAPEPGRAEGERFGVDHAASPVSRGWRSRDGRHPGPIGECKPCNFGQAAPAAGDARGEPERKDE